MNRRRRRLQKGRRRAIERAALVAIGRLHELVQRLTVKP